MYAWIWRHIPGSWPIRLLISLALVALVVVALFVWIFPWAIETFDLDRDVTVS